MAHYTVVRHILVFFSFGIWVEMSLAQSTIISSDNPRWLTGDFINEGDIVNPGADEIVRLVSGGSIVTVTGPNRHEVSLSQKPDEIMELAAVFTKIRNAAEGRRWMRGDGGVPSLPPSLWHVNISLGGTYCFMRKDQLRLWRPLDKQDTEVQITDPGYEWDVFVSLHVGETSKPWPTLPVNLEDGTNTFLFSPDATTDTIIKTARIAPGSDVDTLVSFSFEGCDYQLFLLTQGLPLDLPNER